MIHTLIDLGARADHDKTTQMSLTWLPNTLSLARCVLAVAVGWLILIHPRASWFPFVAFFVVALTDFLDGWAARRLNAVSKFGAIIDPVADKLLVGMSLAALTALEGGAWALLVPTIAIITRDSVATVLRLFPTIDMPVSQLAKWKTALEMIGIGALLLAGPLHAALVWWIGLGVIWLAAALSVYTLGLYLGAAFADVKRPH